MKRAGTAANSFFIRGLPSFRLVLWVDFKMLPAIVMLSLSWFDLKRRDLLISTGEWDYLIDGALSEVIEPICSKVNPLA